MATIFREFFSVLFCGTNLTLDFIYLKNFNERKNKRNSKTNNVGKNSRKNEIICLRMIQKQKEQCTT